MQDNSQGQRLQVFLAHCGVASRRACEVIIAEGRVSVNGQIITQPGSKVFSNDKVCLDGKELTLEDKKRYVLLNKPAGYVCSMSDEKGRQTARQLISPYFEERLYNVGRLDMYSTGLVLFTNDGDFAALVSHPSSELEKEYIVDSSIPIPDELIEKFIKGLRINNVFYRCLEAQRVNPRRVKIILVEGKNREIRRVFEHFQIGVRRLTRVRIGNLFIEGLEEGKFRELSLKEVENLRFICSKNRRNKDGNCY